MFVVPFKALAARTRPVLRPRHGARRIALSFSAPHSRPTGQQHRELFRSEVDVAGEGSCLGVTQPALHSHDPHGFVPRASSGQEMETG